MLKFCTAQLSHRNTCRRVYATKGALCACVRSLEEICKRNMTGAQRRVGEGLGDRRGDSKTNLAEI